MAERLFKFLRAGRIGPFSDVEWPVPTGVDGGWVEATTPLEPCVSGVHVCRVAHLPYWLNDELWEVEIAGAVVEDEAKLVAQKARLSRPMRAWPEPAATRLAEACAWRVRDLAVRELESEDDETAARLAAAVDLAHVAAIAAAAGEGAASWAAESFLGFVSDAADAAASRDELGPVTAAKVAAYVAAYAADRCAKVEAPLPRGVTPFLLERERQARVLGAELGID